jgi:uncharacterized protein YqeY
VPISQWLDAELKEALKSRKDLKVSVTRTIKASLIIKAIHKRTGLSNKDAITILSSVISPST